MYHEYIGYLDGFRGHGNEFPLSASGNVCLRTQYRSRAGVLEYAFALSSLPCVEMVAVV